MSPSQKAVSVICICGLLLTMSVFLTISCVSSNCSCMQEILWLRPKIFLSSHCVSLVWYMLLFNLYHKQFVTCFVFTTLASLFSLSGQFQALIEFSSASEAELAKLVRRTLNRKALLLYRNSQSQTLFLFSFSQHVFFSYKRFFANE